MSSAVLLMLIWLVSGFAVIYIGRKRGLKFGLAMDLAVAFFGPLAIPFALVAKPR